MARKVRLRRQRIYELKIAIVLVLAVTVFFSGLFIVDLNKSYVMHGQRSVELFNIESFGNDLYQVNILNSKLTLNLKYITKDINKIKSYFNIE